MRAEALERESLSNDVDLKVKSTNQGSFRPDDKLHEKQEAESGDGSGPWTLARYMVTSLLHSLTGLRFLRLPLQK